MRSLNLCEQLTLKGHCGCIIVNIDICGHWIYVNTLTPKAHCGCIIVNIDICGHWIYVNTLTLKGHCGCIIVNIDIMQSLDLCEHTDTKRSLWLHHCKC